MDGAGRNGRELGEYPVVLWLSRTSIYRRRWGWLECTDHRRGGHVRPRARHLRSTTAGSIDARAGDAYGVQRSAKGWRGNDVTKAKGLPATKVNRRQRSKLPVFKHDGSLLKGA